MTKNSFTIRIKRGIVSIEKADNLKMDILMKNLLISLCIITFFPSTYTMNKRVIKENNREKKSFFCGFKKEELADDNELVIYIKMPLFKELCVEASQKSPQKPLQELLQKYKEGKIIQKEEHKQLYVVMTRKDCRYRLMSYISKHQTHPKNSVVNGVEIYLEHVLFATEEDEMLTQKYYEQEKRENTRQRGFVGYHSASQICEGWGVNIEEFDTKRHEKIVKKFYELLNK